MTRLRVLPRTLSGPGLLIALTLTAGRPLPAAPPQEIDFNRDIRPILSENCFACHGRDAGHRKADLRLDVRDSAIEAGAIVPGDTEGSTLVERIMSEEPSERMPPPKSHRVLTADQKALLKQWIAEGAKYQAHWAFVAARAARAAGGRGRGRVAQCHRPLRPREAGSRGPGAVARGRPGHADPPPLARPPRSAAGRRGGGGVRRGQRPEGVRGRWSSTSSRARTTASVWPSTGSTPPATPIPTASRSTAAAMPGSGATG